MQPHDHSGEPPDRDAFAQMILDALRAAGETTEIVYKPETFTLETTNESVNQASLSNIYSEYCRSGPEGRAKLVRNFVRSWFAPRKGIPDEYEDARSDLLPSIRARSYIEVNQLKLRAQKASLADWPYAVVGEHLALSLVYDLPESIMAIHQKRLDEWEVEFDDVMQDAAANLLEISGYRFDQPAPGVWQSPYRDNHDTARLILLPLILAHPVKGDPVAMVPNRDTLLLTGSEDVAGLAAMARLAEEAYDHPRSVSGHLLRMADGTWEPWLPPGDNPEFGRFRRMRLSSLAGDCNSQKKALDELHDAEEVDVYVAPCMLPSRKDSDEMFSCTVWTESVDALLPEAERVVFFRPDESGKDGEILGSAPWERVRDVVGDLLVPQEDLYPPRYPAREFPSEEMLKELFVE